MWVSCTDKSKDSALQAEALWSLVLMKGDTSLILNHIPRLSQSEESKCNKTTKVVGGRPRG